MFEQKLIKVARNVIRSEENKTKEYQNVRIFLEYQSLACGEIYDFSRRAHFSSHVIARLTYRVFLALSCDQATILNRIRALIQETSHQPVETIYQNLPSYMFSVLVFVRLLAWSIKIAEDPTQNTGIFNIGDQNKN